MRVLQIIDSLAPGGTERSLVAAAPVLVDLGVDLHVATIADRLDLAAPLAGIGIDPIVVGKNSRFRTMRSLEQLIKSTRVDLVHTQLFESNIAGVFAAKRQGVPRLTSLVSTEFGSSHYSTPDLRRTRIAGAHATAGLAAAMTTQFHAVSQTVADHTSKRLRVHPSKITVIPRGRDATALGRRSAKRREATRARLGLADEPLILVVARHEFPKAIDVAIDAFIRLSTQNPAAVLAIAGSNGSQTEVLHLAADVDHVKDRIHFLGARDDVADLMGASDVLCFPSRREGMPGTLIEAMALELPIVATDLAPNREVLGPDADLVPLEDAAAMAQTLRARLETDTTVETGALRERFEENFTLDNAVKSQVDLYKRTIEAGAR